MKKLTKNQLLKMEEREISKAKIKANEKKSKINLILLYITPICINIIIAIAYIATQNNFLLIPFAIVMFIILIGWDGSTRICPYCKKWNAIIWLKSSTKKVTQTQTKKKFGKEKPYKVTTKVREQEGKCCNCGREHQIQKNIII